MDVSGRFSPRAPGTHWIGGWAGPRAVLDATVKRKTPSPRRESNPGGGWSAPKLNSPNIFNVDHPIQKLAEIRQVISEMKNTDGHDLRMQFVQ